MEQELSSRKLKALYDHKRFPRLWQAFIAVALMQWLASTAISLINMLMGGDYSQLCRTEFGADMLGTVFSQFFALLLPPIAFMLIFRNDFSSTLRLKKGIDAIQILLLVITCFSLFFILQIINGAFINDLIKHLGEPSDIVNGTDPSNVTQLLFQIVIVAGMPAIFEEIFFRGYVLRAFERFSPIVAIIVSSLLFSIMHGNLQQVLYAFMMGILLGTVTVITDSLLAGTVIHFVANAFAVIISYPPITQIHYDLATNYALIYSVLITNVLPFIGIIALTVLIFYSAYKNKRLYDKPIVSDLDCARLMPRQKSWEKVLCVIGAIMFLLVNVTYMHLLWYYPG